MKYLFESMACLVIGLALGCDAGDLERVPPGGEAPMGQSDPAAPATHVDPAPSNTTSPPDETGQSSRSPVDEQRTVAPAVTEDRGD